MKKFKGKSKKAKMKRRLKIFLRCFSSLISLCLCVSVVNLPAQSGGSYDLSQTVVAAGGGSNSTGGNFRVDGTVGQSSAGNSSTGGAFSLASGFWSFNAFAGFGFEGDVAPRSGGDGVVLSNDVIQVQRFQIGLDVPNQSNELQRADSAPFSSKGDNLLQSNDVVQTQRYQIGLDMLQTAAGPGAFVETIVEGNSVVNENKTSLSDKTTIAPSVPRELHIQNASASPGQQVVVNILVDAMGDESAYGFRVTYNQTILTNPTTAIGTAGGARLCNTATAGQINCSINNFPDNNPSSSTDQIGEIHVGNNQQLLRITFTIAANAAGGTTPITLSNVNASDDAANNLTITSQNGTVTVLGPTAATVAVSGKVVTAQGRSIRNVLVTMTDESGNSRTVLSSAFGYFRFEQVTAGETYIFSVRAKRFTFSQPTIVRVVTEDISELVFVADF